MPIFCYHCEKCNSTHEEIRKIADAVNPSFCPGCGEQCKQVPGTPSPFVWGRAGSWNK